jgi:hypothetical protein
MAPSALRLVCVLSFLALAGCGQDDGAPAAAPGCDAKTGMDKDRCLHDEIGAVPGAQPDVVVQKAQQIQDPMIRGAAVSGWVADHANELPQEKGQQLCNLLEGRDKSYCQRRLSSPHLQR